MLTASMLTLNGAGRVNNAANAPTSGGNGYTPMFNGALCTLNAAPSGIYSNGLQYAATGQLLATENAPASYLNGIAFDSNGRVSCDSASPIATYSAGLPFTATGRLAIALGL